MDSIAVVIVALIRPGMVFSGLKPHLVVSNSGIELLSKKLADLNPLML